MPRTSDQNQLIREAAHANLLNSAMTVFAEQGYANTSIRKIAAHAGVSVGLLYHYFDNKERLLEAVFENCMAIISQGFAGVAEVPAPLDKVAYLINNIFSTLQQERIFWGLFYSLRSQPAVMTALGDSFRLWTGRLRDIFIACFSEAGLPEPETEAYLLYSLIEGTIQQYLLDPENYPLEAVTGRITQQFTR